MSDPQRTTAARLLDEWQKGIAHKDLDAWAKEAVPLLGEIARGERLKLYPFRIGSILLAPSDKLEAFNADGSDRLPDWTVASTTLVFGGVRLGDGRMALVVRPQ